LCELDDNASRVLEEDERRDFHEKLKKLKQILDDAYCNCVTNLLRHHILKTLRHHSLDVMTIQWRSQGTLRPGARYMFAPPVSKNYRV